MKFEPIRGRRPALRWLILLSATLAVLAGCQRAQSELALTSYRDAAHPEPLTLTFEQVAFWVDATGDYHVSAKHVSPALANDDIDLADDDALSADPDDELTGEITQWLHVHMFWRPRPGRTHVDKSGTDAVIDFAVRTPRGVAVYQGTGFVYPRARRQGGKTVFQLEDGRLQFEKAVGNPLDVIGQARISGTLVASPEEHVALELLKELERASGT